MKFIEEVVVDAFLPTVRSMLAEDLRERGFTQREVADALGISQSAVSKYAHGEVARTERVVEDDRVRSLVDRVGEGLAAGDLSPVGALVEIEVLIRRLEDGDLLAELHEEAMPALADADAAFSVHDPDSGFRERERVLASVRRGLRTLTNTSGFAGLIPNVGANVAECLADARDVDDVAAVPGRLVDVKGRAMVPGEPEFGVSEHVATVLLAAREAGTPVRGAVNVRYTPDIVAALAEAGPTVEFDATQPSDDAVRAAVTSVAERGASDGDGDSASPASVSDTLVLYQTGAIGVEPIVYVLAPTAAAAARVVRELV